MTAPGVVVINELIQDRTQVPFADDQHPVRIPILDQMGEALPGLLEIGGKVPSRLRGPGTNRIPGHPEQVDPPRAVLDHGRDIQPRSRDRAVHAENACRALIAASPQIQRTTTHLTQGEAV